MIRAPLPPLLALGLAASALLPGFGLAETGPAQPGQPSATALAEPAVCVDPFAEQTAGRNSAPARLRCLAARCPAADISRLLYHRAYHAELLEDLRLMARLQKAYAANDRVRLEQGRIFIALAETFAAQQWPQRRDVIAELNRAYEDSIRTVELTIGGYDQLVSAGHR